jgi:hypothetical protein
MTDKVFHNGIIKTVALPAHALPDTLIGQHALKGFHLILPALIGMKDEIGVVGNLRKRLVKHIRCLREVRAAA